MSALLVNDNQEITLSESLAHVLDREEAEKSLWSKIATACEDVGADLGPSAPDFIITSTKIGIFPVKLAEGEEI